MCIRDSPLADRLSSDPERRTLELIYQLRRYLRFARDANWIETIRGLIKLDEVAVPELIVELDHADDPGLLESLGLILCEINDPRSVPALIRAVDRPRRWRDQHWRGVRAENDKLIEAFWKSDELWKSPIRCRTSCGNTPPQPVHGALERITEKVSPGGVDDRVRMEFLWLPGKYRYTTIKPNPERLRQFQERRAHWETWWRRHGSEFLTPDQLRFYNRVSPSRTIEHGMDKIDRAGVARLGAVFPSGPDARLGPVRELKMSAGFYGKCAMDIDRERTFLRHEGRKRGETWERWAKRFSINFDIFGSNQHIHTWQIDNSRWAAIDQEVSDSGPIKHEIEDYARGDTGLDENWDLDEPVTFLFHTHEGTSGILQADPRDISNRFGRTIRYRLWNRDFQLRDLPLPKTVIPKKYAGLRWGDTREVTLEFSAPGAQCMLNLIEGTRNGIPDALRGEKWNEIHSDPKRLNRFYSERYKMASMFPEISKEQAGVWHNCDLLAVEFFVQDWDTEKQSSIYTDQLAPKLVVFHSRSKSKTLVNGFAAEEFDAMDPATALMHRDRLHCDKKIDKPGQQSSYVQKGLDTPVTALFTVRDELVFLQAEEADLENRTITLRYKLANSAD